MQFSEGMRLERKRLKMTQKELSAKSNIAQQTISAIECGISEPTEHTMIMIANGLGCTVGKLLGEESAPAVKPGGRDMEIIRLLESLDHDDYLRMLDFASGLIAARKAAPSPDRSSY